MALKQSVHSVYPLAIPGLILAPISEIRVPFVPSTIKVAYSHGIAPSFNERDNLLVTRNPRRIKVEHQLVEKEKDRLYWTFIVETSRGLIPLATARNKFKRRWNNAFIQALKNSGLDCHGRVLPALRDKKFGVALRGTLEVKIFNATHFEDGNQSRMVQHSASIVKALHERQSRQKEADKVPFIRYDFRDLRSGNAKHGS